MNASLRKMLLPVAALCCAALILSGCTSGAASSSTMTLPAPTPAPSPEPTSETQPQPKPQPQPEPKARTWQFDTLTDRVSSRYAGDDDGCYTPLLHLDGSADILYIDYTTHTLDYLTAPIKLDTALRGQLPGVASGSSVGLDAGHLYGICTGLDAALYEKDDDLETTLASIIRMGRDGSEPVMITLPEGDTLNPNSPVLTEGGFVYCSTWNVRNGNDKVESALWRLDFASGAAEEVIRFEPGRNVGIEAGVPAGFLLKESVTELNRPKPEEAETSGESDETPPAGAPLQEDQPDTYSLFLYNPEAENGNTAAAAENTLLEWQMGEADTLLDDHVLYYWETRSESLISLDMASGESILIATGLTPEDFDYDTLYFTKLVGGRLTIGFLASATGRERSLTVDTATGSTVPPEEEASEMTVPVMAENAAWLLLKTGERWAGIEENEPGQPSFIHRALIPEYALVRREHYQSGTPEFIPITDAVYQ